MNPMDRPRGGGERRGGVATSVTPWGKPTEGKKLEIISARAS